MAGYPALFEEQTADCQHCERKICWHPTARKWLHEDTRITLCGDGLNSTVKTKATPKEDR